ncbi:unnamed protein product [Moneuplotes crassus]|uniref:Uncharacterized protein n=1 Tax=Euplotes crassus TaxID=5936 RepID=A0AAD1U4L6_EUPCR|nr:unnamed protein product [Moneuplotes crassus]
MGNKNCCVGERAQKCLSSEADERKDAIRGINQDEKPKHKKHKSTNDGHDKKIEFTSTHIQIKYDESFYDNENDCIKDHKLAPPRLLPKPSATKRISYMMSKSKKSMEMAHGTRFSHPNPDTDSRKRAKKNIKARWRKKGRKTFGIDSELEPEEGGNKSNLVIR